MCRDYLPQSDEGLHHKDANLYGTLAVEHIGYHNCTVLGESVGYVFDILSSLQGHRL